MLTCDRVLKNFTKTIRDLRTVNRQHLDAAKVEIEKIDLARTRQKEHEGEAYKAKELVDKLEEIFGKVE